ncbi:MAG: imidazoleglycerol-phosphate dehydratase HisB, partial [Candidatus Berkiellales bacterium]
TKETEIEMSVDLDSQDKLLVNTGIGFFDHMLMQLASHGGFGLIANVKGDHDVDDHHTVEDAALALGQAIQQALGDKRGIERFGFLLPMDEALAQVAIDICGRPYFQFQGSFLREKCGELSTELVPHFFRSFAQSLGASLNIVVSGQNTHHMIEAIFKAVGRTLRQAIKQQGTQLPSTKGVL